MHIYSVAAMCHFISELVCCTLCAGGVKIELYGSYKIIIACGSECCTDAV